MGKKAEADALRLERALKIWQVLISAAHNRQILTYELVADLVGVGSNGKGAITIKLYLGIIMHYCKANQLPPLTALVVKKSQGVPGSGLSTLSNHPDRDREKVFQFEWFKRKPLSVSDLLEFDKHQKKPASMGAVAGRY